MISDALLDLVSDSFELAKSEQLAESPAIEEVEQIAIPLLNLLGVGCSL